MSARAMMLAALASLALASGGRVSMTLSGGKSGSVEMHDGGFCTTSATFGKMTISVFAFAANNEQWAVKIASSKGAPTSGSHVIGDGVVTAGVTDKTTGKEPVRWTRYEATEGTVTFSRIDATHVTGSFKFSAAAKGGAGKVVRAEGTFDAGQAAGCEGAAKGPPK
ncbi:MAG: hypothetical protein JWO05_2514 [Gemmatimonadetes bacterium]|nr:hypothetical protein [Gemmatimonadota bacterium]